MNTLTSASPTLTITRFYRAFAALDVATMASCYADSVQFQDEVFALHGKTQTMGMWSMLCDAIRTQGQADWQLTFSDVVCDADIGQAHWVAHYRFSATGRLVHNRIQAQFTFDAQGLILTHRDRFDFWRWAAQALGPVGRLLGWTPMLRHQVQARARRQLQKYLATRGQQ